MKAIKNFKSNVICNTVQIKGGTEPVDTNGTEVAKAKNRRVTFTFIK